jgi:hypothetical protein
MMPTMPMLPPPKYNPFPDHPMYAVSTDTMDGIERTALAVFELHEALKTLEPHYRFLALSVATDELAEIYAMTYRAEQEFQAEGIRDLRPLVTITPVEGPSAA